MLFVTLAMESPLRTFEFLEVCTSYSLLSTLYFLLSTSYSLLSTLYLLHLTSYFLLPTGLHAGGAERRQEPARSVPCSARQGATASTAAARRRRQQERKGEEPRGEELRGGSERRLQLGC